MATKKSHVETQVGAKEDEISSALSEGGAIERAAFAPHRVTVNKAYKMFIGGAFVRSESGRYFQVKDRVTPTAEDAAGAPIVEGTDPEAVNIPRGSRKDVRDAVLAASNALAGWAGRTALNRGQILYRLAEVMESRKEELRRSLVRSGETFASAHEEVERAIDRTVFYAGFCDKFQALIASHNPVAGPHFGFSIAEPVGVVGVVAPERPALLGLVSALLPIVCGGNVAVVVASAADPRTAIVFCECLATSDMPGGVANILTGHAKELGPVLAKHREVMGIDAWTADAELRASLEREGADNVKRVKTHDALKLDAWHGERTGQGLGWIERFLETKTVWHPVGV